MFCSAELPQYTEDAENVIPTKVGIQNIGDTLDSRFHGNDVRNRIIV